MKPRRWLLCSKIFLTSKKKYHDVETAIIDDSHEVNEAISKSKKEWHKWDHLTKKTVWIPKEKSP